jgi:hypothetical protein
MVDPKQNAKSEEDSLRESDDFELPNGETVEVPLNQSIEDLMESGEPLQRYWNEHFFDREESTASKNPERFEM